MVARRLALTLLIVAILAAGAVPARGQDFDFVAVPRITFGLTNQGPIGGRCSTGFLNFSRSTAPGAILGTLLSGNNSFCGDFSPELISGGVLSILTANQSVNGIIGNEFLVGQVLPNGHAIAALDLMSLAVDGEGGGGGIGGIGMTALIERGGATFSQGNLTGKWRIKALVADQIFGVEDIGFSTSVFGSITFAADGSVVTGTLNFSDGHVETITEGMVSLSPTGELTGTITTVYPSDVFQREIEVKGLMAPDKNFVAGVTHYEGRSSNIQDGMFFLQKEPSGIAYTQANLAGVWDVFALQAETEFDGESLGGLPFLGTLTFNASGVVTASNLTTFFGAFPVVSDSSFTVSPQGFISGFAEFDDGTLRLDAQATMFKEKNQIIGVNVFGDASGLQTAGLFIMVKRGPPPPASVVQFSTGSYSVQEGMTAKVRVNRTGATSTPVSVDLLATDPLLESPLANKTVFFAANQTFQDVDVPTFGDLSPGPDRVVNLTLSNPTNGATLGRASALLNVLNDDSTFAFSNTSYTVSEAAGKATIAVTRAGGLAFPASVRFSATPGTALAGKDFTPITNGNLSFAKGVREAKFDVMVGNNTDLDGARTVLLRLFPTTLAARPAGPQPPAEVDLGPSATLTITDNDTAGVVRLSSATYSGNEGTSVTITILRAPATAGAPLGGNVSVPYFTSNNGSAIGGMDYPVTTGTVTFTGTQTTQSISIRLTKDNIDEGPERVEHFVFSLGTPSNGATLGSPSIARVSITDLDRAGEVFLSQTAYKVSEGAGNITITVMRTGGRANASVQFSTLRGTAIDGVSGAPRPPIGLPVVDGGSSDYDAVSMTLNFGADEMKKTVVIPILQDGLGEGDELFTVALSNPQGRLKLGKPASAPVALIDDEVVIQFARNPDGKFRFQNNQPVVVRTGPLTANVSVQYVATSGTALIGDDFDLAPGTLVFPPGVSIRTIPIKTINDNIAEGDETFTITLMNPSPPAQLGPNFFQVFTLDDNDFGGVVNFANTSPTAMLGESKSIVVTRTGGLGTVMTVNWSVIGGTAVADSDFSPASGRFTFLANQLTQSFSVNISETAMAAGKTIVFGLMPPGLDAKFASSKLGAANVSTLTILGTPPSSTIQFSSATYSVNEDQGVATIKVKRTGDLSQPATVHYATTNGTATTRNEDYSSTSGTLTFPATEGSYQFLTFDVSVSDDGENEDPETVNLTLSNPTGNARLGAISTAVLTIHDPQGNYEFTVLYSGGTSVGLPSLNDAGKFAFSLSSTQAVYSGDVAAPFDQRVAVDLPAGNVTSIRGFRNPVDENERVAFLGNLAGGGIGVVVGFNSSQNVIFSSEDSIGEPSVSVGGYLAFKAIEGCEGPCDIVLLGNVEGGLGVAARAGDTTAVGFVDQISQNVAVNNNAVVAFIATTTSGNTGVFRANDRVITTLASTAGDPGDFTEIADRVSINTFGEVAFVGTLPDGNKSIVVASPGNVIVRAVTSPTGFLDFGSGRDASVLINDNGDVAFIAFNADGQSLYIGNDPVNDKVVSTGDMIDGRQVISLQLGGWSSAGQLTFLATLFNGEFGETAAILATPRFAP